MAKDLRAFLADLECQLPREFLRVEGELDPEFEVTAVLQHLEDAGQFPAVLFENVRNLKGQPGHKQLLNVVASRTRIALAAGLAPSQYRTEIAERMADAANHPMPTVTIDKRDAPVREMVVSGN